MPPFTSGSVFESLAWAAVGVLLLIGGAYLVYADVRAALRERREQSGDD